MKQSSSKLNFNYEDNCILYKPLFPNFNNNDFDNFNTAFKELNIIQEIENFFSEAKINTTENQAALHHIYRSAFGKTNSDVDKSYIDIAKKSILQCKGLKAMLIQRGIKNVVTIGIGGSFEGPKLLLETLTKKHERSFNHIFLTGPDEKEFIEEIEPLNSKETFFIVSSKSMTTDETLLSLDLAKKWMGSQINFENHFICITSQAKKAKNFGFNKSNIIKFPNEIGGRYSIWSPISLAAILELGDIFIDFLKGGSLADESLLSNPEDLKFIKTLVFSDIWHHNNDQRNVRVLLTYSWKLKSLTDYVQQLEMESNGKNSSSGSNYNKTGQVIFGGYGSTAQHSYFQLLHQGTVKFCADIINISSDIKENKLLYAQSQAQAKLLSFGESENLEDHEKVNGRSPVNLFSLKEISAFNIGYLIATWEHRVFLNSRMLKINPFDQYGVGAGKIYARKFLDSDAS